MRNRRARRPQARALRTTPRCRAAKDVDREPMAGITSRIPVDEVIDAMGEVGRRMPVEFRETALGGLAVTPTGTAIQEHMRKSPEVAYDS